MTSDCWNLYWVFKVSYQLRFKSNTEKMRIFGLLLLCFSLAFANVSYAQSHEINCPMSQGDSMGPMVHADKSDCCNDFDSAAKTGDTCKSNKSCSSSQLVIFATTASWNLVSIHQDRALSSTPFMPYLAPTDLWRPPTLSWSHYLRSVSSWNLVLCLKHLRCLCSNAFDYIGSSSWHTLLSELLCSKAIRHQSGEFIGLALLHYWMPVL